MLAIRVTLMASLLPLIMMRAFFQINLVCGLNGSRALKSLTYDRGIALLLALLLIYLPQFVSIFSLFLLTIAFSHLVNYL